MSPLIRSLCIAILAARLCPAAQANSAKIDPKARAVLEPMVKTYADLKSYQSKCHVEAMARNGTKYNESHTIKLMRPNKVYRCKEYSNDAKSIDLTISDGASLWEWDAESNSYTKSDPPKSFNDRCKLNGWMDAELFAGIKRLADFFPPKSVVTLGKSVRIGAFDTDVVNVAEDTDCFGYGVVSIHIARSDHLIHQIDITFSGKTAKGKYSATIKQVYDLVDANPSFTDADFTFTPPAGAKLETPTAPVKPVAKVKPKAKAK